MEIPHFGSMRGKERELIVLRSDNGDTWKEHQLDIRAEDLTELLAGMDEGERVSHASQYQQEWQKFLKASSESSFAETRRIYMNICRFRAGQSC